MGRYNDDKEKKYIECPAGKDDKLKSTVFAFHPDLFQPLRKADNGKAVENFPFILEGEKIQGDGSVVSVSLAHDPKVLREILRMRKEREANTGVSR